MPLPALALGVIRGAAGLESAKNGLSLLANIKGAKTAADQMGTLIDEVVVTVTGTPLSTKRDLYFLAASVGFGLVQRLVPAGGKLNPFGSPGRVGVHYDATSKEVTFVLHYTQNLMTIIGTKVLLDVGESVAQGANDVLNFVGLPSIFPGSKNKTTAEISARMPVLSGPRDEVVGQQWGFGLPIGSKAAFKTPDLPFAGKTVLTDQQTVVDPDPKDKNPKTIPTLNPRPSGDARSRGSLCWLVYQSLATPAESSAGAGVNNGTGSHTYALPPSDLRRFAGK